MDDKKRGKNFSEAEKSLLIDLVIPYRNIIENIKTGGASNKEKDAAWNEIGNGYNCQQVSGIRSIRQLKSVYDVQKRKARKDKSDNRVEVYKTGGGCNFSTLSNTTEKVIGILADRLDPLQNHFDSDSDFPDNNKTMNVEQLDQYIIETINEEVLSDNSNLFEQDALTNKRSSETPLTTRNKVMRTIDKQSINHDVGTVSTPVTKNIDIEIKKHGSSSKKVYEGLHRLTSKHLSLIDDKEKVKENLNSIALRKTQLHLETAEIELKIAVKRQDTENEKNASELRQMKLKEQILESEFKQNKMKETILTKQLCNM